MNEETLFEEDTSLLRDIETYAGQNYGPGDIAKLLHLDVIQFKRIWANPDSVIRQAYDRGVLQTQSEIRQKITEKAKKGNQTAIQQWEKSQDAQHFENMKNRFFNGS